jgi:hypothetical protein
LSLGIANNNKIHPKNSSKILVAIKREKIKDLIAAMINYKQWIFKTICRNQKLKIRFSNKI